MPVPKPRKSEKQADFVARCHEAMAGEFEDSKQRHAVCMQAWRSRGTKSNAAPEHPDRELNVFQIAQAADARTETLDGRDHVVLPMIALVEGVFQCANCDVANFYAAAEFAKNPGAWNGRPVTISHPQRGGTFVSAGSPDVWQSERIGTVFNTRLDGDRLRCEAWIDPEMVERAGEDAQAVMAAIDDGEQVEVSTGTWVEEQPRFGSHKGRKFQAVFTSYQPDHIAILKVGERGACNWADGCGIRVATASVDDDGVVACCDDCASGKPCGCSDEHDDPAALQTARSLEYAIQVALEAEYGRYCHAMDYDETYVYFAAEGREGYRRRGYTEAEDGSVTLAEGEDERVRPSTEFVVVNSDDDHPETTETTEDEPINQEDGEMPETNTPAAAAGQQPPKPDDNPQPPQQQPPQQPQQPQPDKPAPQPPQDQSATLTLSQVDKRIAELEAKNEYLTEQLDKLRSPKAQSVDEYIDQAPEEIRHTFRELHKAQAKRKLGLVDDVLAAPGCMWSREELERKALDELERLVGLAARTDFSVQPRERTALAYQSDLADDDYTPLPASPWDKPQASS